MSSFYAHRGDRLRPSIEAPRPARPSRFLPGLIVAGMLAGGFQFGPGFLESSPTACHAFAARETALVTENAKVALPDRLLINGLAHWLGGEVLANVAGTGGQMKCAALYWQTIITQKPAGAPATMQRIEHAVQQQMAPAAATPPPVAAVAPSASDDTLGAWMHGWHVAMDECRGSYPNTAEHTRWCGMEASYARNLQAHGCKMVTLGTAIGSARWACPGSVFGDPGH
jgi:hypothetical protein